MGTLMIYHGTAYDLRPRPIMVYRFAGIKVHMFDPKLKTKPKQTHTKSPKTTCVQPLFCRDVLHQDRS
eukprot:4342662-Amphidinium_carterae.1